MSTIPSVPTGIDPHQTLTQAIAHRIEHMTAEELQTLVVKAHADLQTENAFLRQRLKELEAENERLHYRISRSLFNEKDYENFDPSEYTVPAETMLANARKRLKNA